MKFLIAFLFLSWFVLAVMAARIFREPIETRLELSARSALDKAGLSEVAVSFDHLDATLTGNVADRATRQAAERAVERVRGGRIAHNHVTFGQDLVPSLLFAGGAPVRVSGSVGDLADLPELGEGFDSKEVVVAACARHPWGEGLGGLARMFFRQVKGGRLELEGRRMILHGEVANDLVRWRLLDEANNLGENLDIIDELTLAEPIPFQVTVKARGDGVEVIGRVRDEHLRQAFLSLGDQSGEGGIVCEPTIAVEPWLIRLPAASRRIFELALDATLDVSPEQVSVSASFTSQFWLDAAERALRDGMPAGFPLGLDFQVARKAVAEGAGPQVSDPGEETVGLPIRVDVADHFVQIRGKVRSDDGRDELVEVIRAARPGLEVIDSLEIDREQAKLATIREKLPSMLAYVVAGITDYGSIDLTGEPWLVSAFSDDPNYLLELRGIVSRISRYVFPVVADLCLRSPRGKEGGHGWLAEYPIYFKSGSAQITSLQREKLETLAEFVLEIDGDRSLAVVGLGHGDGDRLVLQRARAVRRVLVQAGVPSERLKVGTESARGPLTWRSELVYLKLADLSDGV